MTNQMFNSAWTLNQHFNHRASWRLSISVYHPSEKPQQVYIWKHVIPRIPGVFLVSWEEHRSFDPWFKYYTEIHFRRIEISKTFWAFWATNLQLPEAQANTHTHTECAHWHTCKTILEHWNVISRVPKIQPTENIDQVIVEINFRPWKHRLKQMLFQMLKSWS